MGILVSTCVSTFSFCTCSALSSASGRGARLPYLLVLFLTLIGALLLKTYGAHWIINAAIFKIAVCQSSFCVGNIIFLKVCLALFMMFITTTIASFVTIEVGRFILIEMIYLVGLIALNLFIIPDHVVLVFVNIARVGSLLFLLLQVLVFIDFAYRWNESWASKEKTKYYVLLVLFSLVFLIASIVGWVLFFRWFASGESCSLEQFFAGFTIAGCSVLILLSITEFCENGSLLSGSVVSAYCTYLLFSSLRSNPNTSCNSFSGSETSTFNIILSTVLAVGSITYSSWSMSTSNMSGDYTAVSQELELDDKSTDAPQDAESFSSADLKRSNIYFHLILCISVLYASMLLTEWSLSLKDGNTYNPHLSPARMWMDIGTQWCAFLIYLWTLFAPSLFPDREF